MMRRRGGSGGEGQSGGSRCGSSRDGRGGERWYNRATITAQKGQLGWPIG